MKVSSESAPAALTGAQETRSFAQVPFVLTIVLHLLSGGIETEKEQETTCEAGGWSLSLFCGQLDCRGLLD
mgnify:CR=1 FL=1